MLLSIDADEAGASFYQLENLNTLGMSIADFDAHMGLLDSFLTSGYPIIAAIDTRELPHWNGQWALHAVVVSGLDSQNAYLHDPAFQNAPIAVDRIRFESAWLYREYLFGRISPSN